MRKETAKSADKKGTSVDKEMLLLRKKAGQSLGLLSVSRDGEFAFSDDRLMKCFRVKGAENQSKHLFPEITPAQKVTVFRNMKEEGSFLTFTLYDKDQVRAREEFHLAEDRISRETDLTPLSADDYFLRLGNKDFSLVSALRRKESFDHYLPDILPEKESMFSYKDLTGTALITTRFPERYEGGLERLFLLDCPIGISLSRDVIPDPYRASYQSSLEKRYLKRRHDDEDLSIYLGALQVFLLSDSKDACLIARDTAGKILTDLGFSISPAFSKASDAAKDIFTLGLLDTDYYRQADREVLDTIQRSIL